jgi:hypothetical protein
MTYREREFRAWSPKFKKMIYGGDSDYTINIYADGRCVIWKDCIDDENAILMDFTHHWDSTGKKIFEGDKTQYGEIEWLDGWCINGDRLLRAFKDLKVFGNIFEK